LRLTEIKLAGFKSFVDPTAISVPGQLVGIVGPNGCGKSNVIDAVRWVLGESSARHLRGETMQDVIFNGSGDRQPAARASVELLFDNRLGKAGGQWSAYADIAIRRVLTRDGNSEYFINNLQVRRRDVADLFLGTGVGARAYGIIEQGMISRIIEAKPEELRVFLEEAAGVSKYRERRRETEARLADTRDNLQRVEDIRQELGTRIEHLRGQAEVAGRFRDLQKELATTQSLLWFIRRQDAQNARARQGREIERVTIEIEAETAQLRDAERRAEELREAYYAATDTVNGAQGQFYEAGHAVSRLEQQIQYLRDSRARLDDQIGDLDRRVAQSESRRSLAEAEKAHWEREAEQAKGRLEGLMVRVAAEAERLPQADETYRTTQTALGAARSALARTEQAIEVASTRKLHAERVLQQLAARLARLEAERAALPSVDPAVLEAMQAEVAGLTAETQRLTNALEAREGALPGLERRLRETSDAAQKAGARLTELRARHSALEQLQSRIGRTGNLQGWIDRAGLGACPRIWQSLRIADGWETALEAVLRERLSAVVVESLDRDAAGALSSEPPAKVTIVASGTGCIDATQADGLEPFVRRVTCSDAALQPLVSEWLDRVFIAPDRATAVARRAALPPGGAFVTPDGFVATRHSVSFHVPDNELHGVLARAREIEALVVGIREAEGAAAEARSLQEAARNGVEHERAAIVDLRQRAGASRQAQHGQELEVARLGEQVQRTGERRAGIEAERAEIAAEQGADAGALSAAIAALTEQRATRELEAVRLGDADARHREADRALAEQRQALAIAEKESQEAVFLQKSCIAKIADLAGNLVAIAESLGTMSVQRAKLDADREGVDEEGPAALLQAALGVRQECEQRLAAARDAMQAAENAVRDVEAEKAGAEARTVPLRARIEDLRLKEQEARLTEEQYAQHLAEAGADEVALASMVEKGRRAGALQSEIAALNESIAALGSVNLAAVDELAASEERKSYLDSQSTDLTEALGTLENAIRKIDRETRELLQHTFDEVNRHFATLFPALFGGGNAKLVLTGDEILDAGIHVVAQPPGKRNQSIHLLSGGEKALTALSLVFSMFQLNPAPFCLLDEVDAPLDDHNTGRFCDLVKRMAENTQFVFISHNKLTMELAEQLVGVTMQELGVSRIVAVDIQEALRLSEEKAA
jgi:chromosome segregation protein